MAYRFRDSSPMLLDPSYRIAQGTAIHILKNKACIQYITIQRSNSTQQVYRYFHPWHTFHGTQQVQGSLLADRLSEIDRCTRISAYMKRAT
jgi:hypothetical protein